MTTNHQPLTAPISTLVFFAVDPEVRALRQFVQTRPDLAVRLTGIGPANAQMAISSALTDSQPKQVLSCGFAGGLNPALSAGAVVFEADTDFSLTSSFLAAGVRQARFHCATQVISTGAAKQALWQTTGADAVEMESQVIRTACRRRGIPSATVRVILDTAAEDMPLDFNHFLTPERKIDHGRLALVLLRRPLKIEALLQFRRRTQAAARILAEVLAKVLS